MIRTLTIINFLCLLCLSLKAQQTFTDRLTHRTLGNGCIVMHQSSDIEKLINGNNENLSNKQANQAAQQEIQTEDNQTEESNKSHNVGNRVTMSGFRIQIYAGGNSRQSKQQAESAAARVRIAMPTEVVYTNFISPRWVCRVGDYRSYEEAYQALQTLNENGGFGDAVIVKSKILVYVD